MASEPRVDIGQPIQRLPLVVSAGRLEPATLAPRVDRVNAALKTALAQQLRTRLRRERHAGFDALPQEPQSHVDHAVSVAAHRTVNTYRADFGGQLHAAQRIQAPADTMPGWRHVDDAQRLARQPLPVMPDQTDVRQAVQTLA